MRLCRILPQLLGLLLALCPAAADEGAPITTAAAVRALSNAEAARGLPVRVQGVITYVLSEENAVVQDSTSGIWLWFKEKTVVIPGQQVVITGVTAPGNFAPGITDAQVKALGTAPLPEPRQVTSEALLTGDFDCTWVELTGPVRRFLKNGGMRLEVVSGSGRVPVELQGFIPEHPDRLVGASVRVRGIPLYSYNRKGQIHGVRVVVPGPEHLTVLQEALGEPPPVTRIENVLRFSPGTPRQRVHIRGVVLYNRDGLVFVGDSTGAIRVRTHEPLQPQVGDQIDVLGFPVVSENHPLIQDALCWRTGAAPTPAAAPLKLSALIEQDGQLVKVRAVLTAISDNEKEYLLTMQIPDREFRASLPRSKNSEAPWQPGSELELTGVCNAIPRDPLLTGWDFGADEFELLLRNPADVVVLSSPPWWSGERALFASSIAAGGVLCILGVLLLRARWRFHEETRRRQFSEAQFTAILAERSRLARDIHDTLAQGFTAISVHLEMVRRKLGTSPEMVLYHVDTARQLVQSSLSEARRSIWEMRSQVLENTPLSQALRELGENLAKANNLRFSMHVSGRQSRLSPRMENDLLRIGQEGMTNAARHAGAESLVVTLIFAPGQVALSIRDDGRGFDIGDSAVASMASGGFGMAGMRERAARMHAHLDIISSPGEGTEIHLLVPLGTPIAEVLADV
ncbi:MAG TPA: sensor histidine kinase [Chthoniobacteraceae bacterium]|jgi:signal transduction histidine kinase